MRQRQTTTPAATPATAPRLLTAVVALLALVGLTMTAAAAAPRSTTTAQRAVTQTMTMDIPRTQAQVAFHDQMRKLWEDHVTWTRLAIVQFAADDAGFSATAGRLLQNQTDIGDAVKPFYGAAAGDHLAALLHDHITIAVEVLQAAKSGDTAAFTDAKRRWYDNANAIADFLAAANPKYWSDAMLRDDMRTHLDQTLTEAAHELAGDYPASITDYEAVHAHILEMADMLSSGIINQFPSQVQ